MLSLVNSGSSGYSKRNNKHRRYGFMAREQSASADWIAKQISFHQTSEAAESYCEANMTRSHDVGGMQ